MEFNSIADFVEACAAIPTEEIRWCDAAGFNDENLPGAAPGGYLNVYGYYVVGTTIGGNAICVGR